jgi:hypothetical protein
MPVPVVRRWAMLRRMAPLVPTARRSPVRRADDPHQVLARFGAAVHGVGFGQQHGGVGLQGRDLVGQHGVADDRQLVDGPRAKARRQGQAVARQQAGQVGVAAQLDQHLRRQHGVGSHVRGRARTGPVQWAHSGPARLQRG